jgi:hypothetical protein
MITQPPKEFELLRLLRDGEISLPPCTLELVEEQPRTHQFRADGVLRVTWKNKQELYNFEYKASGSPQDFETQLALALYHRYQKDDVGRPLLTVRPFLREDELRQLDEHDLSGFDLCGNAVIIAPDFRVWRTGNPNRFEAPRSLRNPFAGDSSIFARCFLLRPDFNSLSELQHFAQERTFGENALELKHSGLVLGTASKVVRALTDEGVIEKLGQRLHLVNAKRLLALLRQHTSVRSQTPSLPLTGKTSLNASQVWSRLRQAQQSGTLRGVATGLFSAGHYEVLSGVDTLALYVNDIHAATNLLEVRPTRAFANIELHEERKNLVYFDTRIDRHDDNTLWASPIQTWFELMRGGPREQEAGQQLQSLLLSGQAMSL